MNDADLQYYKAKQMFYMQIMYGGGVFMIAKHGRDCKIPRAKIAYGDQVFYVTVAPQESRNEWQAAINKAYSVMRKAYLKTSRLESCPREFDIGYFNQVLEDPIFEDAYVF